MATNADLNQLITKRTSLKQQFARYKNQINFNADTQSHFNVLLKRLEPLYDELFMVDTKIEEVADNVYVENAMQTITKLYEKIETLINKSGSNSPSLNSNLTNINWPRITLPSFDGSFEK